ncbi:MAG: cytochrome c oxidase subunit II [Deltaproteobacteria bacterium]|nr:cytochrome c oxidase subunit II [Deltaproteobacteria bacterium]
MAAADSSVPMSYLRGFGQQASAVVPLTWAVLALSIAVVIIIGVLLLGGIFVRRARGPLFPAARLEVSRTGHGLAWIYIGVGVSGVFLLATLIWTLLTLARVDGPPGKVNLTIEVTGYQWWWQVRYMSDEPSRIITTANEIHIPTGQPVRVVLLGGDVIHSFWVPRLAGKRDAIPGQRNEMWLEAAQAGRYRGQCGEYCGWQHAHMAMYVIAESPAVFQAWWNRQLQPAPVPISTKTLRGENAFVFHCGTCHTVRGTQAGGKVAPDLTHLMSRSTIAAGTLPTTIATISGWIANPQAIKPGNRMPVLYPSGPDLEDIRSFLKTLK